MSQLIRITTTMVLVLSLGIASANAEPIRVLVWDEQQPKQKVAYPKFLGNQIAEHLRGRSELAVKTARLDDPDQGLSPVALDRCDVLIWWGHVRQGEISAEKGREIVQRIEDGKLALLVLHSAHWSVPFMEAMETKASLDAVARLPEEDRANATVKFTGERLRKLPPREKRAELKTRYRRTASGAFEVELERPNCVFPACCHPAEPALVRTLLPKHPIADSIPATFTIPETEMYDEPFGVPTPDVVVFEESWKDGEHFRSGAVWHIGKGNLFYFRPGHETYKVFFEEYPLRIVGNAAVWLGQQVKATR